MTIKFTPVQFRIKDDDIALKPQDPTFLGTVDKLSNIQALGDAGKGLKAVAQIAGAGGPKLQGLINGGATKVLDTIMGAGSGGKLNGNSVLTGINKINPSAVNTVVGHSEDILGKLKDGKFNLNSIPTYTRDFANVFKIGKGIFDALFKGPPEEPQFRSSAPNYAASLHDVIGGVKTSFRYLVLFKFANATNISDEFAQEMKDIPIAFFVKTSDRPQMEFESEDINFYNFRTKVIKRGTFKPVNMTFYDDQISSVLSFLRVYLSLISPITNIQTPLLMEETGLDFSRAASTNAGTGGGTTNIGNSVTFQKPHLKYAPNFTVPQYPASFAAVDDAMKSQAIISEVSIIHLYQGGMFFDEYKLHNPKILDFQLSGLDHSTSEASTLTFTFGYDYFTVDPQQSLYDDFTKGRQIVYSTNHAGSSLLDLATVKRSNLHYKNDHTAGIYGVHTADIQQGRREEEAEKASIRDASEPPPPPANPTNVA